MQIPDRYLEHALPAWAAAVAPWSPPVPAGDGGLEERIATRWDNAVRAAARPRLRPVGVADIAPPERQTEADEQIEAVPVKSRAGRFGSLFGTTVHQAISLVLHEPGLGTLEAVRRAAAATGLVEHTQEAVTDVERALAALEAAAISPARGAPLDLEYPIAGVLQEGELATGYIDLVAATADRLDVIDFKTDTPPAAPVEAVYAEYATQVTTYGRLLEVAGLRGGRRLRCGLLFTADGVIRWIGAS